MKVRRRESEVDIVMVNNIFIANDIDIVDIAPAGYLGDSFRTDDSGFTALNKVSIKGDGERYGVSFEGKSVFDAANVSVTGNSERFASEVNNGIWFNGVDLQNAGNVEFVSNGAALTILGAL